MPLRMLPSAVVAFIDSVFPFAADPAQKPPSFDYSQATVIAGLAEILDAIPQELIRLSQERLAAFIGAVGMIRASVRMFEGRVSDHKLKGENIRLVRNLLTVCPDDVPSPTTTELLFVQDLDLRDELRHDISRANNALVAADWKAATVLSGSVVEALLLWALSQQPAEAVTAAAARLHEEKVFAQKAPTALEEWTLHHYAEVAGRLGIISKDALIETRLAKDFRNLIHPGRALRLSRKCDRGTALAALAAVEMVVSSLTSGVGLIK